MISSVLSTDAEFLDDGYLHQCASTYNWDELTDRCRGITDLFLSCDTKTNGKESKSLPAARRLLTCTDEWGNNPLHAACFNNPPEDAIDAILEAAMSSSPPIPLVAARSKDGSTPLVIACGTGASIGVIDSLLKAAFSLKSDAEVVMKCDCSGGTPLSELCNLYEMRRKSHKYRYYSYEPSPPLEVCDVEEVYQNSRLFRDFWDKVLAISEAAWFLFKDSCEDGRQQKSSGVALYDGHGVLPGDRQPSLLHRLGLIAHSCPEVIARLGCRSYPEMISFRDWDGYLPFHCAITGHPQSKLHPSCFRNTAGVIGVFLDCYPQSARESMPGSGRTPLCQAIMCGLPWHVDDGDDLGEALPGPLMRIWKCAPEALHSRDVVTGLYPFMLAATLCSNSVNGDNDVGTVYSLLRQLPALVRRM